MPWAGLVAGLAGLVLTHQGGSEGVFNDCAALSPGPVLLVALVGIALALLGGFESWRVLREKRETQARRLVAIISIGSAALFVIAMVLPMLAALIIPACYQ